MTTSHGRRENRLARASSAYLRQHGTNPVDWYPWGEEALEKARREDKPIFLSIGYSACHWCHVMERESFEDEAVAALLNTMFVPIKVDREERPDLDQIYQTVVQLLGKSGGWPLSVFLTPEQKPFYGGTYFPPEPRYGMPSFSQLLSAIREAYDQRRDDVVLQAKEITDAIAKVSSGDPANRTPPYGLGPDLLARATKRLSARFDDEHGGFGSRPKFPSTMSVEVLLRRAYEEHDGEAEARVRKALDGMRDGGIWDHLGGGFHRYSTDEKWLVPHFEKMLYDNAQLLRLYLDASRAFHAPSYLETAKEIGAYLLREMQSASGAFFATQDADSEGEEGKFFVWTPAEVDAAVSHEAARALVKEHFGVTPRGNFEETGATVLSTVNGEDRLAIKHQLAPSAVSEILSGAKAEMLAAREERPKPFRDEKMLACWNGLVIGPLAELSALTGDARFLDAAKRAFEDVTLHMSRGGRVARYRVADGTIVEPGFLDDHANLANAALDLYEVTGEASYVVVARHVADQILARFADPDAPGFFLTPSDGEALLVRMKDNYDQATPSASAMTSLLLLRLGALVDETYAVHAAKHLESVAPAAVDNAFGFGQTIGALDRLVRGSIDVVIVGRAGHEDTEALRKTVLETYVPNRSLVVVDPHHPSTSHAAPLLAKDKPASQDGRAIAYVCRDRACSAPVSDRDELRKLLRP